MNFLIEFFRFVRQRKKYFLIPILIPLLIIVGLLLLSQGTHTVAPFIYTILLACENFSNIIFLS